MTFEPQAGVLLDFGRLAFTNPLDELQNIRDTDTAAIIGNTLLANMAEEEAVISQKYQELGRNPPAMSLEGSGYDNNTVRKMSRMFRQHMAMSRQQAKPPQQIMATQASYGPPLTGFQQQPGAGVRPPQRSFRF